MNRLPGADKLRLLGGSIGFLLLLLFWIRVCSPTIGLDFPAFYVAAQMDFGHLYSRAAFALYAREHLALVGVTDYPPYVRPAIFAIGLKPLALFSFWPAFSAWAGIAIAAYFVNVYLLLRWLNLSLYLLAALGAFYPAMSGIVLGHDITMYTLVMTLALLLLLRERDLTAGVLLGLCAYKFNLFVLVPFVLIAHRRWKALMVMAASVTVEAGVSALLASPSSYVAILRGQTNDPTVNARLAGLRGLLVHVPHHEFWYPPLAILGLIAVLYLIRRLPLREGFCVALIGALLLGYKTAWYDCTLLIISFTTLLATTPRGFKPLLYALLLFAPIWIFQADVVAESALLVVFAVGGGASWPQTGVWWRWRSEGNASRSDIRVSSDAINASGQDTCQSAWNSEIARVSPASVP